MLLFLPYVISNEQNVAILRTPEACQEISRGLSERERAQPPVVEPKTHRSAVRAFHFPSNFATRFSLYALKPSAASALANAWASSSRSNARPSDWLLCMPV